MFFRLLPSEALSFPETWQFCSIAVGFLACIVPTILSGVKLQSVSKQHVLRSTSKRTHWNTVCSGVSVSGQYLQVSTLTFLILFRKVPKQPCPVRACVIL
uniref:Uncharacterized protein n=1 Tax=Cacopsylla melanoneura TaxID=428564 RepID=A0A8D8XBH3_9HEMI